MRYFAFILVSVIIFYSCNSGRTTIKNNSSDTTLVSKNDTIHITNEELEYEIIIIEIGFDSWLVTQPPMGHYGLPYLESKNRLYVLEYNNRVHQDLSRKIYEEEINYDTKINYGLEVNYLLYNYFKYFQQKYKQKL